MSDMQTLIEAQAELRTLVAASPPAPWAVVGDKLWQDSPENRFAGDPMARFRGHPDLPNSAVAAPLLVVALRQAVPGLLWLLHCGINELKNPASSNPRSAAAATVALAVSVANGILGRESEQTLALRARLMDRE